MLLEYTKPQQCWIYSKARKWPQTRNINKPFFKKMWQHNNVMWELTNFCFSLKFPFVPFWCYKVQSCEAFSIYVTPCWPIYPYNIFRQGTKRTQCGGTPFVLDKLQIAHIAHPTFAFNLELSSFQHSTFRLNRIKWK